MVEFCSGSGARDFGSKTNRKDRTLAGAHSVELDRRRDAEADR